MKIVQLLIEIRSFFGYTDNFSSVKRALFGIANTRVVTERKTERQKEGERDKIVNDTDEEGE